MKKLIEVANFTVCKGVVFYNCCQLYNINILNININEFQIVNLEVKIKDYHCVNGTVVVRDDSNYGYHFRSGKFEQIGDKTLDSFSNNFELGISTKWISYFPVKLEHLVYHIDNQKIMWTSGSPSLRFEGNMVVSEFAYGFSTYDQLNGNFHWTFSLPENKYNWYTKSNYENAPDEFHRGEIFRIIGEYKDVFWIVLNSGVLLGLNSETGELCYELIHPNNYHRTGQPFNLAINTQLDSGRGILFGLRNKYYWEVDLQNPATNYSLYNIAESCNKWNISADMPVREWSWAGDKIYFGEIFDSPHNQKLNNVGVFDRANKEVIHAMRIGEGGKHDVLPNIQKIQFESGRLYVLDGRKVLHILE